MERDVERKRKGMHGKTMCVHYVFFCFINRIRVMRYWWGRDSANNGRGKKKKTKNRKERATDKNREVD